MSTKRKNPPYIRQIVKFLKNLSKLYHILFSLSSVGGRKEDKK